jgi:peptidylprolyl isomerase
MAKVRGTMIERPTMKRHLPLLLLALTAAAPPTKLTPTDAINAAPASAWRTIPAEDLLVMTLDGGARVVIQLAPAFAPVHVANIRRFAGADYWQGAAVYRVQDNYVAQWGINEAKRALSAGAVAHPPAEYVRSARGLVLTPLGSPDPYALRVGFSRGWAVALYKDGSASLTHCYGTVGVGRDLHPDTGAGGELYAAIGHGPRQLDRNIAIVGRVISGIEHLSALPRGSEAMGFYKEGSVATAITGITLASAMPAAKRPSFQYLDTASPTFARYLAIKKNRHDDFYRVAAGGADLCNVPVPVRPTPGR